MQCLLRCNTSSFLQEICITLIALIWFLPSVYHQIWFKTIFWQKGFNALAVFIWFLLSMCQQILVKDPIFLKTASTHWLQLYGFSPVCIHWCDSRSNLCEKALSHWLHGHGFSPLCHQMCLKTTISRKKLYHIGCIHIVSHLYHGSNHINDTF